MADGAFAAFKIKFQTNRKKSNDLRRDIGFWWKALKTLSLQ